MKTKLLKKVKEGIYAKKVKLFGIPMYRVESSISQFQHAGFYCASKEDLLNILRQVRLESARTLFIKKRDRRMRV